MFKEVASIRFFKELKNEIKEDNVSSGAAALAFYMMLSIFPAMIAMLSFIPYLPIPNLEQAIMEFLREAMPPQAAEMFSGTINDVMGQQRGGLLTFGVLLAIWSASNGLYAIMQQLNYTYDVKDSRSFIKVRAIALFLTVAFGVLVIGAFCLVIFGGVLQNWINSNFQGLPWLAAMFAGLRWIIILAALLLAFAMTYYFGPNVEQDFKYITPGSVFGVLLLVLGGLAFRFYVENFANYSAVYGSIGAVIILLFWLYLTGWVVLLGSEINALVEHHSADGKDKGEKKMPEQKSSWREAGGTQPIAE